jgi:uncharacterized protein with PhoU and TrkA domain
MKKEKHRKSLLGRLQRTPQWKQEEFTEIEYEPVSVKVLLTEMKDISELIIDLAYSALLFNSTEIAEEVRYLEVRMDKLNYEIRITAMMATRTKEDAEQLAGILQIAQAAEKISNSAGDLLVLMNLQPKELLPRILENAEERIFRIKVSDQSMACSQSIGSLRIESETGMRVIAIRREKCWIYNPQSNNTIQADDILIVKGTDEGFEHLNGFLQGKQEVLD